MGDGERAGSGATGSSRWVAGGTGGAGLLGHPGRPGAESVPARLGVGVGASRPGAWVERCRWVRVLGRVGRGLAVGLGLRVER